jgi:5'-nucleotidase
MHQLVTGWLALSIPIPVASMTTILPLLCFNDVYRVKQRFVPQPGSPEDPSTSSTSGDRYINVSQFGHLVHSIRDTWADRQEERYDGAKEKDGLILFAGDVFNPSVESSVTRGSHMVSVLCSSLDLADFEVPIMNALKVDIACIGEPLFKSHEDVSSRPRKPRL